MSIKKSKQVHYFDLGASLYTPSTHPALLNRLQHGMTGLRSMVVCLEDAIKESELAQALENLNQALDELQPTPQLKRFIRPRNPQIFEQILNNKNIHKIDGFILPKFDLNSLELYKAVLKKQSRIIPIMPTLETPQVFDPQAMILLAQRLQSWRQGIICLRIGGNDLMNILGIKRMWGFTIYDTPLRGLIDQLVIQFRTQGFELSAPVFDFIDDTETLKKEIALDLAYGFFSKTAIHPIQIPIIEAAFFDFTQNQLAQAQSVLNKQATAAFKLNGQMMEPSCHQDWARRVVQFAKRYQDSKAVDFKLK